MSQKMSNSISFIIPISNGEVFLSNQDRIFSQQSELDNQFILVLDSLADSTKEEIVNSLKDDQRDILIVECEEKTAGGARNFGLNYVNRNWIVFCDSDDEPHIYNYERAVKKYPGNSIIIGEFEVFSKKTSNYRRIKNTKNTSRNVSQMIFNPGLWRMVFPANVVKKSFFAHSNMGEDQSFLIDVLREKNIKIIFESSIFYRYVVDQSFQLTNNTEALDTLPISIAKSTNLLSEIEVPEFKMISKMLIGRMTLTSFTRRQMSNYDFKTKLRLFLILLEFMFNLPLYELNVKQYRRISSSQRT